MKTFFPATKESMYRFVAVAILIFSVAPLLVSAQVSPKFQAQQNEAAQVRQTQQTTQKIVPTEIICGLGDFTCSILKILNWLLDALGEIPFQVGKIFLSTTLAFNMNLFSDAGGQLGIILQTAQLGWRIVLQVMNILFILVLLWVAIATIFDFAPFTARAILPNLIIIALLINFSFAIGAAIIKLGNGLAVPFWNALEAHGGVENATRLMFNQRALVESITNKLPSSAQDTDSAAKILQTRTTTASTFFGVGPNIPITADECYNIIVKHRERAPSSIGKNIIADSSIYPACQALIAQADVAAAINRVYPQDIQNRLLAMVVVVKLFLIPVAVFVIFAAAIFLLVRMVSLMGLIIFAPFAFFSLLIPQLQGYWKTWWQTLFQWTFYLPAFLFLFLLSTLVLQGIGPLAAATGTANNINEFGATVAYLIGLGLMIFSLTIARKMGIHGADFVIGLGSRAAGAVGGGISRYAGRKLLAAAAPAAKGIEESDSRAARWLMKIPGVRRGLQNVTAAERQTESEYEKRFERFSGDELKRRSTMKSTSNAELTAIANILVKRKELTPDKKGIWTEGKIRQAMAYTKATGGDPTILDRAAPHLTENIGKTVRGMKAEHIERMDRSAFENAEVLKAVGEYWTSGHFARILSYSDSRLRNKLESAFNEDQIVDDDGVAIGGKTPGLGRDMVSKMSEGTKNYFRASAARGLGWNLRRDLLGPASNARPPTQQTTTRTGFVPPTEREPTANYVEPESEQPPVNPPPPPTPPPTAPPAPPPTPPSPQNP